MRIVDAVVVSQGSRRYQSVMRYKILGYCKSLETKVRRAISRQRKQEL